MNSSLGHPYSFKFTDGICNSSRSCLSHDSPLCATTSCTLFRYSLYRSRIWASTSDTSINGDNRNSWYVSWSGKPCSLWKQKFFVYWSLALHLNSGITLHKSTETRHDLVRVLTGANPISVGYRRSWPCKMKPSMSRIPNTQCMIVWAILGSHMNFACLKVIESQTVLKHCHHFKPNSLFWVD